MSAESLAAALALIGIVILVSSLLSGIIEHTGLPQVAIFLVLGAVLGPSGLNLVQLTL
jgi:Kef-type K+ transport system membrane component KefB